MRLVTAIAVGGGAVLAWLGPYVALTLRTRPKAVTPGPAGPALDGPEPPAVVALLTNRWRVRPAALQATLLDLAARGYVEFRQPGADPRQTTLHLRHPDTVRQAGDARGSEVTGTQRETGTPREAGLTPYEYRVLDRVANLSRGGVLPITAMTFRDADESRWWRRRVTHEIVVDARRRGLSRPRLPRWMSLLLMVTAGLAATTVGLSVAVHVHAGSGDAGIGVAVGLATFVALAALTMLLDGERDTPAGRQAAAAWHGLGAHLVGDRTFRRLPPAAVGVRGRYLAFGLALGAAPGCAVVMDLGMGDRHRIWSTYGGQGGPGAQGGQDGQGAQAGRADEVRWRRVRVRYPRLWWHYGRPAAQVAGWSAVALVAGVLALLGHEPAIRAADGFAFASDPVRAGRVLQAAGAVLAIAGAYGLLRVMVDVATPVTITGEVLWKQLWRRRPDEQEGRRPARNEDVTWVPRLYHLAVDDGRRDRTRAWALPVELQGSVATGHVVRFTARRWTRRVLEVNVVDRPILASAADVVPASIIPDRTESAPEPGEGLPRVDPDPATLVTTADAARALDLAVEVDDSVPDLGLATRGVLYRTAGGRGVPVLGVSVLPLRSAGATPKALRRARRRGTPLPGVGDEAYVGPGWALARRGPTGVSIRLLGRTKAHRPALPGLLALAVGRLPQEHGTSAQAPQ